MVASTSRMPSVTIRRQPTPQQKRKCTRADPAQVRILHKNYESQARPSAAQFADISQETNLPVEWIKKWFLRKRKADGKNRTLTPTMPTFVENEPPAHGGQALGHAHSKFWSVDAFVAADSNSFSPSVGRIPKFYGHHRHTLPSRNPVDHITDSLDEEETIITSGESARTGDDYTAPCRSMETATPAVPGGEASTGQLSPSANEDTPEFHPERFNVTHTVNVSDPGSTLLPEASPVERSIYPDDSHDEMFSGSDSAADLEFTLTNYTVSSVSSPDTIDDFILASENREVISATSCNMSKYFESGSFGSVDGHLDDPDLGPFLGFSDLSNRAASALDESSAFYESFLLQAANQDLVGGSVDFTDCSGLLGIDFCLGAARMTTGYELESTSAFGLPVVDFHTEVSDPTAYTADFGGFDIVGGDDNPKETVDGVDSGEGWWMDAFDTMFV